MVWIPKEPKYKPKPPKPNNTPTNTPMNRGEAIKVLRLMKYEYLIQTGSIFDTALDMAIEALKQERQGGNCPASRTPPSTMKKIEEEFRGRLARSIKAAGRWMEDNAEGIAGTIDGRTSLGIWLRWECSGQEITPDINIDGDFLCREAIEEMFRHE